MAAGAEFGSLAFRAMLRAHTNGYERNGADLVVACLGLDRFCAPLTERRYTCVELIAICFRACNRWPRRRSAATTIPTLLSTVGARLVLRVSNH
jgi:hypothetical protein